jgi:hypothetical protein
LGLNNFAPQPKVSVIRFILLLIFQTTLTGFVLAQVNDSSVKNVDSAQPERPNPVHQDSVRKKKHVTLIDSSAQIKVDTTINISPTQQMDTSWLAISRQYSGRNFVRYAYQQNRFFGFSSNALLIKSNRKVFEGKELLFYSLLALLLFFAFIRLSFPKYISDLFRVAFKTTLKQRQIGEQLVQTPLPSLLLNFFFLVSSSMYISFVLGHFELSDNFSFWLLCLYCFIALAIIYVIKFISLKFFGWLFNITPTTDGYIFIVFMINKIIGIYLLPFLVILAFTSDDLYQVAFVLSYTGVLGLLAYRFILSYGLARNQIRVNPFHFFLYLCAFEIVPLLLIYKAFNALVLNRFLNLPNF